MTRLRHNLFLLALLMCAQPAMAQVRPPARDTLKTPPDTTRPAQDTTPPTQVFADSVRPIPQLARPYLGPAHGFSDGVWTWDRTALQNEAAITLSDLLQRIPGVLVLHSGLFVQPEAASSLGGTGNRVEVWLDGYVLDPLLEGTFDLARLELAEVDNVRVERRPGMLRIHIETLGARDNRPYSMVEAAVGQPTANLFRGIFLAPKLFVGPAGLAIDRIDGRSRGLGGIEPADHVAGWAKWSFIRSGSGLQVEYRRATTDRDPAVPWPEQYTRTDLVARARLKLVENLVVEAFGGRSRADADTSVSGADSIPRTKADNKQYGGRISFESPFFWANAAFRARDAKALPATQADGSAGVRVGPLSAVAQATRTDWRNARTASELTLRADAGPFGGLRVFGETTSSDRGVPYLTRSPDSAAIITPYTGYRAGADFTFRGITLGGALLHAKTDSVTTFGLPFDTAYRTFPGSDANGFEVSGRLALPFGFAAEGTMTDWRSGDLGLYMPARTYRAGLELHAIPLKSGNLELIGRIEAIHRGGMFAVNRASTTPDDVMLAMPAINYIDSYFQIRIMDVRAFVHSYNMTGQSVQQLPDRSLPGPRVFYGVKWQFFN